ncbi:structural cement protein Gp24 [Acinetobacter sp. KS-LM10]|uniref:structural cement protein Gp24 n=1 Tax=Acinetobacter sp. KS-LM10 TaxID=3120518 RepID=UPI0030D5B14F
MGNSFLYRMPSGIAGDVSRKSHSTIEAHNAVAGFAGFGLFGKLNVDGKFTPLAAGDTAASIYGLIVRSYPVQTAQNALGVSVPAAGFNDVLRRGYMTVKCNAGTAKTGGKVFVRVDAATEVKPLGGIEAVADAANTIEVNAIFMHAADASGNVEISYNI